MIRYVILFMMMPFAAFAAPVAMDVDEETVKVTTGFVGQDLTIFGVDAMGEIANITITGPRKNATVRKKSRVFGAWMNTDSKEFKNIPSYYAFTHMNNLPQYLEQSERESDQNLLAFKTAIVRNEATQKYYNLTPQKLSRDMQTGLFNIHLQLPANVPVGEYHVNAYNAGGEVLSQINFRVKQTGWNAKIQKFARHYGFFYALSCILLAVSAGWISNRLRRA